MVTIIRFVLLLIFALCMVTRRLLHDLFWVNLYIQEGFLIVDFGLLFCNRKVDFMLEFWFIYGYDKVFFHGLLMVYLWLRKGLFPC